MRDLEIRGCGNILGGEQHGHIEAVGFDTYTQLVEEAVAELKGEPIVRRVLPPFDVAADAFIPEEYVPSEAQKITLYKRIATLKSVEEVDEMFAELGDRFGRPPAPVKRLLDIVRVRATAIDLGITRLAASKGNLTLEFGSAHVLDRRTRGVLMQHLGDRLTFAWQDTPTMTITLPTDAPDPIPAALELLKQIAEVAG